MNSIKRSLPYRGADPSSPQKLMDEVETVRRAVRRVYKAMDRVRTRREQEGGVTRPQSSVIELLFERPGLSLKEIAAAVELSQGTVSGIIERLVARDLVRRVPDTQDRRVKRHYVTEHVKEYADKKSDLEIGSPILRALKRASREDRAVILEGLARLERLLKEED
ncbi:MAG: hypothetical protein C4332_16940 [Meiothermus sp.]